jgi:hypothetical protein
LPGKPEAAEVAIPYKPSEKKAQLMLLLNRAQMTMQKISKKMKPKRRHLDS